MAFVVTLEDITPPRRSDAVWTQALLSEAPTPAGVWTLVETILLSTLPTGLDTDPTNPKQRDLTTTHATAESGLYYSVVWKDAGGNNSQRSIAVFNNPFGSSVNWRPTVQEVATLIRARAVDRFGNEDGTFTADTTPSYEQADEIIDKAVQDLYPVFKSTVPDAPVPPNASPEAYREAVSALAAARAALLIELTVFGKEVSQGNSPYKQMYEDYRNQLLQVATMLGLVVPGLTPTGSDGQAAIEGSHISIWGNEVTNPYTDMMTRPL
jgi:hypothetical protein